MDTLVLYLYIQNDVLCGFGFVFVSPPPHTMCHTPHWASAGRLLSITLFFSNFFRPTPSWLSPGPYSRSIAAKRRIVNYHAMPSKRQ